MIEMTKKIPLAALLLLFAIQIYLPVNLILDQERVLKNGSTHRFKVLLGDPSDPFRGKFVYLQIAPDHIILPNDSCNSYSNGEIISVELLEDSLGFVRFGRLIDGTFETMNPSLEMRIGYPQEYRDTCRLNFDMPFNRYYMQEFKAPEAERLLWNTDSMDTHEIWLNLKVKDGKAVSEGLYIDGTRIEDYLTGKRD